MLLWWMRAWPTPPVPLLEMARNRIASGIVMVPCFLLGSAFFSTAIWGDAASGNRPLALGMGALLVLAGCLALLIQGDAPDTPQDPVTKPDDPV